MVFDYLIIGGGISGSVCAYELSKKGKHCIILEKEKSDYEKICGGGVAYKALDLLKQIDMPINELFDMDSSKIIGHMIERNGNCYKKDYPDGCISLGIRRNLFDGFLRRQAEKQGVKIVYGETVSNIERVGKDYQINGYKSSEIILANGARRLDGSLPANQSIGVSAQIKASIDLDNNLFYYWYYDQVDSKYFWAFPIGDNLWNIGIWCNDIEKFIESDFMRCFDNILKNRILGNWKYLFQPRIEFLGHYDQRLDFEYKVYGVGDFAGKCNPKNGGGIIYAISSGIACAREIL